MQVVGFDSGLREVTYDPVEGTTGSVEAPALLVADGEAVTRVTLERGFELAYTLGTRHCAGSLTDDGHERCEAPETPYCPQHASDWPCARCTGRCDLPLAACREAHAVYLAAFAPATFKVGVTRLRRLVTRLREQGADRGAHLHTVSNGRIARRVEREIATALPDRVGTHRKVMGLGRRVDGSAWTELLDSYATIETFAFDYGLDIDAVPLPETVATGTVLGTKGRLLVLGGSGGSYAVDLRDLVGCELSPGATSRELQTTLGAFD